MRQLRSVGHGWCRLQRRYISSCLRLDDCNQLVLLVSARLRNKLQSLQNAARDTVTETRMFGRIAHVMRDLLPVQVRQRLKFKTAVLVFQSLAWPHCSSPTILHVKFSFALGQSVSAFCSTRTTIWNSLPAALRTTDISCCRDFYTPITRCIRLSNRLFNRFHNRLYRVNGILGNNGSICGYEAGIASL